MHNFKETEFGTVPANWKFIKAKDFCLKVTDGTHDSPKQVQNGKYLITSKHIKGRDIDFENAYQISEADHTKINLRSQVNQWDVIISMIGEYCGFTYIERNSFIDYAVKNVGMFKTGNETNAKWLHYFLSSKMGKAVLESQKTGTSQPYITLGSLRELDILVPDDPELMCKAAEVLSSLDDKIDLLHRNNKTLEEMAETLFRQWFVEGAKEDWEVKRLDDICSHIKKSVNPKKEGSTLFLHYSLPAYDNGKRPELTEASAILSNKYLIQQDDMLISKLNPRTPRVWMIGNTALNSICSTEFQVYRAKEDCYRAFSYCFLKTQQVTDTLAGAASGTSGSHQRVNPEDISALEFTLPPIELLQRFQSVVKPAFDKIQLNNQTILNLETTRNSLLPKLMSGQVRVMSSI